MTPVRGLESTTKSGDWSQLQEEFITQEDYDKGFELAEEISKMLWSEICSLEQRINKSA